MTEAVLVDQAPELKSEALSWPEQARAIQIRDAAQYTTAADMLKSIKGLRQRIAESYDPHIKRAHEAHKALVKDKQDAEAPLADAESVIKRALITYDDEQERLRIQEERRRQEEARKQEEERRLAEAAALEREAHDTGNGALLEEALALVDQAPTPTPIVAVEKTTPKVSGVSYRETWSARVVNPLALVKFVAAHPEHINLVAPNLVALNQLARSMKGAMKVDGVQAVMEKQVAAGSR